MADASFLQYSFLGGEWSPLVQGRADHPWYKTGMNVCRNSLPVEEGAWTRRSGTIFAAITRGGSKGRLISFNFSQSSPYNIELTDGYLRLFTGASLAMSNDAQIVTGVSNAVGAAVVSTLSGHGWLTGDYVQFSLPAINTTGVNAGLRNRQFKIGVLDYLTFQLFDPITGLGIDGTTIDWLPSYPSWTITRVLAFTTPYTAGAWANVNAVQDAGTSLLLHPTIKPQVLQNLALASGSNFATFSFGPATFLDGPYMDPPTDGAICTPSALGPGIVTMTIGYPAYSASAVYNIGDKVTSGGNDYVCNADGTTNHVPPNASYWTLIGPGSPINGGKGFVSTDVGRMMRFFSEPALWGAATAYVTGNVIKYSGLYYTALANSTGKNPDTQPTLWAVNASAATWTWGVITTVTSTTQASVALRGGALLYTVAMTAWRMGLYSDTTGYPTCGTYHEGRFWLAGAQPNRLDSSYSNQPFNFAPTDKNGVVGGANGISYVFNATDINSIFWMIPDHQGIVCGTQAGEWLVEATTQNQALTPTNIQAHRVSKYGVANIPPVRAGLPLVFVQRYQRKVMEYIADAYSGKFSAKNISFPAKHLTAPTVQELAYQAELAPVVWARCGDGSLIGCTYKRESLFTRDDPTFAGWHRHDLGSGRLVESIVAGPSVGGNLDSLAMVTNDPATGVRYVELLGDLFDATSTIYNAQFVDTCDVPQGAQEINSQTTLRLYGYSYAAGKTLSVFGAGLDLGDYVVAADGSIDIPFGATFGSVTFNDAWLTTVAANGVNFGSLATPVSYPVTITPPANPPTGTIQIFDGTQNSSSTSTFLVPDWVNNRMIAQQGVSTPSFSSYIMDYQSGSVLNTPVLLTTTFNGISATDSVINPPVTAGRDKKIYFYSTDEGTQVAGILRRVQTSDFTIQASFGTDSTTAYPTDPTHAAQPTVQNGYAPLFLNGNFLLCGGKLETTDATTARTSGQHGAVSVVNCDGYNTGGNFSGSQMSFADFRLAIDEGGGPGVYAPQVCTGPQTRTSATGYVLGFGQRVANVIGLYKVVITDGARNFNGDAWPGTANPDIVGTKIGTVTAANIDAAWSTINGVCGPVYDATDGHVMAIVHTTDAVTNKTYLIKINTTTAAVVWKLALSNSNGSLWLNPVFNQSRIQSGKFFLLDDFAYSGVKVHCHVVTTATGADAPIDVYGITVNTSLDSQFSDDQGGAVYYYGSYTQNGANPPAPRNPPNGTYTPFVTKWAAIQMTAGNVTPYAGFATRTVPFVAGFNYISQGQLLRQLEPQTSGAQNGPALGKTTRKHMVSFLMQNSMAVAFGTVFSKLHNMIFASKGGKPLVQPQLFSDIYWNTIESDYSFNEQIAWQTSRPYPATVLAIQGFAHTQDR